jgi:hypothetical protein
VVALLKISLFKEKLQENGQPQGIVPTVIGIHAGIG